MKRKILLPILICLAVVGSVAAATAYTARVSIDADPDVGHTKNAELAVFFDKTNPIANDVLNYTGSPKVVEVKLKKVQRDSEYIYKEVLKVQNNKPYNVWLTVEDVSTNLGDWYAPGSYGQPGNDKFNFKIMAKSTTTGWQCFWVDGHGGSSTVGSWGWILLTPGETVPISFYVQAGSNTVGGSYTGMITFKALAPAP